MNSQPIEATLVKEPQNPFALQNRNQNHTVTERATTQGVISRQAQEVQAAMVIAKQFPRDEVKAWDRIMKACSRPKLAEDSQYSYPKGGANVSGPSIRLAEAISQNWGNIESGVIELSQHDGESEVMAYAWDLETNSRDSKVFTVKHSIHTKSGPKILSDPRDIYELVANQGARRKRACILALIPGDVVDDALAKCDATMANVEKEIPIIDRVKKMVTVFDGLGVTPAMIEKRFNKKLDKIGETELNQLRKMYASIRDGFTKVNDQFEPAADKPTDLQKPTHPVQKPEPVKQPVQPSATVEKVIVRAPEDDVPMDSPSPFAQQPTETKAPEPVTAPAATPAPESKKREPKAPKADAAPKEAPKVSNLETLKALITTEGLKESEVIAVCVRKYKGAQVESVGDWTEEYADGAIQYWKMIADQIKLDRAIG